MSSKPGDKDRVGLRLVLVEEDQFRGDLGWAVDDPAADLWRRGSFAIISSVPCHAAWS